MSWGANTSLASGQAAAQACGIPHAFAGVDALVASDQIDIVAVTVKVPHHLDIVSRALRAGKHVYCEWPLGNGLAEAVELAALARESDRLCVIGTQARVAPEMEHMRQLVAGGYVGQVLSSTLVGSGVVWGPVIDPPNAYTMDAANGATMLSIPFGHTMATVCDVLGEVTEVSARLEQRRSRAELAGTGRTVPIRAPDQVLVHALFASGVPLSAHYRGGLPRGTGLLWEINGTEGDLQPTAAHGQSQLVRLALAGARGDEREPAPIAVPEAATAGWPDDPVPGNVARVWARMAADLRHGTRTAPDFEDALRLHRLLDAIGKAAESGRRITLA